MQISDKPESSLSSPLSQPSVSSSTHNSLNDFQGLELAKSLQLVNAKLALALSLVWLALCGSAAHAETLNFGWSRDEQKAIAFYKQGNYQLAENLVDQILLVRRPGFKPRLFNLRAICLAKLGKLNESNMAFREAEKSVAITLKPHERIVSSCRLKILYASAPEQTLLKRYSWMRDIKPAIKGDLIDLITSFCVIPDDDNQQSLG